GLPRRGPGRRAPPRRPRDRLVRHLQLPRAPHLRDPLGPPRPRPRHLRRRQLRRPPTRPHQPGRTLPPRPPPQRRDVLRAQPHHLRHPHPGKAKLGQHHHHDVAHPDIATVIARHHPTAHRDQRPSITDTDTQIPGLRHALHDHLHRHRHAISVPPAG